MSRTSSPKSQRGVSEQLCTATSPTLVGRRASPITFAKYIIVSPTKSSANTRELSEQCSLNVITIRISLYGTSRTSL